MKISISEPKSFIDCIKSINDFITEGRIVVDKEKLRLTGFDPANVCMVDFEFSSDNCKEWDVADRLEIPLNLSNLKTILRRATAKDILTLEVEKREGSDKEENLLLIKLSNKSFTTPMMELEEKEAKLPDLKFDVVAKMDSDLFTQSVGDCGIVAESVVFLVDKNKLFFHAEGELNRANVEFGDKASIQTKSETAVKGKYSIEYLNKIVSGSKIGEKATIEFSKDYPLKVEFAEKGVRLTYLLAPRVEND